MSRVLHCIPLREGSYAGAFLPGEHDVFPQQVLKLGSSFILGRLFSSSAHSIHQLLAFHSGYRPDEADEN